MSTKYQGCKMIIRKTVEVRINPRVLRLFYVREMGSGISMKVDEKELISERNNYF